MPLSVEEGIVIDVVQGFPGKGGKGFTCVVRFDRDGKQAILGAAVDSLERVKGVPKKGAKIRIEHHGELFNLIFTGRQSLFLESMTFTE